MLVTVRVKKPTFTVASIARIKVSIRIRHVKKTVFTQIYCWATIYRIRLHSAIRVRAVTFTITAVKGPEILVWTSSSIWHVMHTYNINT